LTSLRGFIAQFEATNVPTLEILSKAAKEGWSSEEVLNKLLEEAGQIRMARAIFKAFRQAAILLGVVITIDALLSILPIIH
jgi:5,10-methenyltetrahydromethanopterin hydrogenase